MQLLTTLLLIIGAAGLFQATADQSIINKATEAEAGQLGTASREALCQPKDIDTVQATHSTDYFNQQFDQMLNQISNWNSYKGLDRLNTAECQELKAVYTDLIEQGCIFEDYSILTECLTNFNNKQQ